jgi:hypothetical protein|tara:strand:- start:1191 stop:1361 length:171 start_codon:yes stop_codon:yes gene_type:complete
MATLSKSQARKRLLEARMKIVKVMHADNLDHSPADMKKMYDITLFLGRFVNSNKLK